MRIFFSALLSEIRHAEALIEVDLVKFSLVLTPLCPKLDLKFGTQQTGRRHPLLNFLGKVPGNFNYYSHDNMPMIDC